MLTHTQFSLAVYLYTCCDSTMPLLLFSCLCSNSKWCPSSLLVTPPSCYCLSNASCLTACTTAYIHIVRERTAPFHHLCLKKGVRVGLYIQYNVQFYPYGIIYAHSLSSFLSFLLPLSLSFRFTSHYYLHPLLSPFLPVL